MKSGNISYPLDTADALAEYTYDEANARRLRMFDDETSLPVLDERVADVRVREEFEEIDIHVWVELDMVTAQESDITTAGEAWEKQDLTTLVDVLGTEGVFREIFLALEGASTYSKGEISERLRSQFYCKGIETDPTYELDCAKFVHGFRSSMLESESTSS